MVKKKNIKLEKKKEPLPKEGTVTKYIFWFITNYNYEFFTIIIIVLISLFLLLTDIGRYVDQEGNAHWTISKKAMQIESSKIKTKK